MSSGGISGCVLTSMLLVGLGACAHDGQEDRRSEAPPATSKPTPAVEIDTPPAKPEAEAPPKATANAPPRRAGEDLNCSQDKDSTAAKQLFRAGVEHFQQGDYGRAASGFVEAYRVSCKALTLFNAARAYQLLGDHEAALDALQTGLKAAESDDQRRQFERELEKLQKR